MQVHVVELYTMLLILMIYLCHTEKVSCELASYQGSLSEPGFEAIIYKGGECLAIVRGLGGQGQEPSAI